MLRARAAASAASAAFAQLQRCRARTAAPGQRPAMRLWLPRPAGFCGAPCLRQRARYGTAAAGPAGHVSAQGGSGQQRRQWAAAAAVGGSRCRGSDEGGGTEAQELTPTDDGSARANTARQARLEEARELLRAAGSGEAAEAARAAAAGEAEYRKALSRAMRLINYRERSARELLQRLGEEYAPDVAARAVARMQELNLVDDERFAEMFARGRWRASVRAPTQIAWELKSRGVSEQHVRSALEAVFGPGGRVGPDAGGVSGEEGSDGAGRQGQSAWAQLLEQAGRRAELSRGEDIMKRRAKLARWLQYRGHNWDTVKRVMREVGL